jgi:hypothetical protein
MQGKMDYPAAFCAWKAHELTGEWPAEEALSAACATSGKVSESELHETMAASLQVRESAKAPHTVELDGVLIVEGLSKNGNYYTLEALQSAPAVFAGKPILINHPSRSEDHDRPEGDLWTQVGKLPAADGFAVTQRPDGQHEVRFTGAVLSASPPDVWIADRIRAGIIGDMSINAGGEGFRESSSGNFRVTKFTAARSHDLVTAAAAGGKTTALHESDINPTDGGTMSNTQQEAAPEMRPEMRALVEAEVRRVLREQADPLAELPEELKVVWAGAYDACMAGDDPDEAQCTGMAWLSVVTTLMPAEEPPTEEQPDAEPPAEVPAEEPMAEAVRRAVRGILVESSAGRIMGMGGRSAASPTPQPTPTERIRSAFASIPGFTNEMADIAAKGRG